MSKPEERTEAWKAKPVKTLKAAKEYVERVMNKPCKLLDIYFKEWIGNTEVFIVFFTCEYDLTKEGLGMRTEFRIQIFVAGRSIGGWIIDQK